MSARATSWMVCIKATGEPVTEIYNRSLIQHLKPEYEAEPILSYLYRINDAIKAGQIDKPWKR